VVNRPGRIGREGEHKAIQYLVDAGFPLSEERDDEGIQREGRRAASLDVVGRVLRIPVEVKRRARLDLQAWARDLNTHWEDRWALFLISRDARRKDAPPDMMVLPAALGAKALKVLHETGEL